MQKVFYYIGSNNATHELEEEKILSIVGQYFDGFTAFEVVGYWKGKQEKTLKIEVVKGRVPIFFNVPFYCLCLVSLREPKRICTLLSFTLRCSAG